MSFGESRESAQPSTLANGVCVIEVWVQIRSTSAVERTSGF
jgi:hypothetical protein